MIVWFGLFLFIIYFYNEMKNLKDLKGGCLFVVENKMLKVYDFIIFNFKIQEDKGIYLCDVNIDLLKQ